MPDQLDARHAIMTGRTTWVCRLTRNDDGALRRAVIEANDGESTRVVQLRDHHVSRAAEPLRVILGRSGIKGRHWSSSRPLEIDRRAGHQAELLFRAVGPLRRPDRIDRVADGIARMSDEEVSYWHAKATQPGGLRALRIILEEGPT